MRFEDLKKLAFEYYNRKDIQKILLQTAKGREVVPRYIDSFGKRPDTLQYENDIISIANKGATSFHYSEEIWKNPLDLTVGLTQQQMNNLRAGWDLILDIDCDFIDYGKITAEMLVEALHFHKIKNIGLKFSGGSGFHVGISFDAFPKKVQDIEIKDFFPDGPRIIAAYLKEMISKHLSKKILRISTIDEISKSVKKPIEDLMINNEFNPFSIVEIDTVLISSRHLLRMPYSLHERTGLASIVIRPDQIKDFHLGWAKPQRVIPKPFLPEPVKNEAKELLVSALDWHTRQQKIKQEQEKYKSKEQIIKAGQQVQPGEVKHVVLKNISPELYPPCVINILKGMHDDGRKRALFILINFFRSINLNMDEIKNKIDEWNKLNYTPLREGYIKAQLSWFEKQKNMLPPNCDKPYYKDIGVCFPDFFCGKIKNPVNYVSRRIQLKERQEHSNEQGKKKKQERM